MSAPAKLEARAQTPRLHTPQWVSLVAGGIAGGVEAAITGTTAKAAVRFVSYDKIRNSLAYERGVLSAGRGMLAGMTAGAVESVLAVTPTERIKTALLVSLVIYVQGAFELIEPATESTMQKALDNSNRAYMQLKC
ncbi:hypothetical protein N7449_001103 [Penicillium cf. viridicatum]|uniref:Uncharacterized protein n=1 Tax=Penicillium cf. viridicatum TaxID=2972119 RepID=A0A9W9T962_9EURO|nr:hypothetical protein N7449_001103 [Penicillium cf. viridicatum]